MTERITERPLWERLKESGKPIILYGMGNGADMIIEVLESLGLTFSDTFASDAFVRGQLFHGKPVLTLRQVEEKYRDFTVLMTFAVHDRETLDFVRRLSQKHELYSPTVPVAGSGLFTADYIAEHDREFDLAYSMLADEESKRTFVNVLNFKISGKTDYLFSSFCEKERVYREILTPGEKETFVDLGAYDGDTVREFLAVTGGQYYKIIAFEPDGKNFRKLERNTADLERIERYNLGAGDKEETLFFAPKAGRSSRRDDKGIAIAFNTVDNLVKEKVTLLKMDIEGDELRALEGAKNTVRQYLPKLYVCAYHRNEDFFALPQKIRELSPEYQIYLRQHPYIPAWECNFYAVAK